MTELNPAQQAACDFAFGCVKKHPRASAEIASYHYTKGKDGAVTWRDYCYVPINFATSVTNRIPAIAEIDSIQLARKLCCSLAWLQAKAVVEFVGDAPIERNGGGNRIARRELLSLPEYALYLPARGADLSLAGSPVIGTFAFIDDRDSVPGRRFAELNVIALVDLRRAGIPVFPVHYFCALIDGQSYERGVRLASATPRDPAMANSPAAQQYQREAARFIARIAGDLEFLGRSAWANGWNAPGTRSLRPAAADGCIDLSGDLDIVRMRWTTGASAALH
ncbi:MAG: hypothetical protein IPH26_17995 [Sterolibacteriaceae bacterium]|uniref:Uncharacterized protein n=1 Tax=Candidatus Methylophosphatis roskildensis TaxID=2899263 RepID=A0A9D7HSM1_9PROT|nr:hypothetical protein [Candidatus Methylophosphatis roskildensis]MBK7237976.1 hypothetical protein [Sterolibacteriaceae bacterium]